MKTEVVTWAHAADVYGDCGEGGGGGGGGAAAAPGYCINASTNRLLLTSDPNCQGASSLVYDANGRLQADPVRQYSYDAEGEITGIGGSTTATYAYNEGQRTGKTTAAGWTDYIYINGQPVAEQGSDGTETDYIYADGQKIAKATNTAYFPASTDFYVADQVGSTQVELSGTGTILWQGTFTPFGQEILNGGTSNAYLPQNDGASTHYKFTGKERDTESGLDYFGARYYGSSIGRFMSPDPLGGHTEDPQPSIAMRTPGIILFSIPIRQALTLTSIAQKNNGTTCQGGSTFYKDATGDYKTTVIKSDDKGNLSDQSGNKYSGTFDGKNVSFAGADGSKSNGSWIQGSGETKGITGGGDLSSKFDFTFSNHGNGQSLHATFNYTGTFSDAQNELYKAGYSFSWRDQLFNFWEGFSNPNAENYRTPGDPGTGGNSGHFLVNHSILSLVPRYSVPTTGSVHTGETNPTIGRGAFLQHLGHEQ